MFHILFSIQKVIPHKCKHRMKHWSVVYLYIFINIFLYIFCMFNCKLIYDQNFCGLSSKLAAVLINSRCCILWPKKSSIWYAFCMRNVTVLSLECLYKLQLLGINRRCCEMALNKRELWKEFTSKQPLCRRLFIGSNLMDTNVFRMDCNVDFMICLFHSPFMPTECSM